MTVMDRGGSDDEGGGKAGGGGRRMDLTVRGDGGEQRHSCAIGRAYGWPLTKSLEQLQ